MKKIIILLIGGLFLMLSCKKDEEKSQIKIVAVASERVDCIGLLERKCYAVKYEGSNNWTYIYDDIEGFTYEPGYEYVLKIRVDPVKNPYEDASSLRYIFLETLSKIKKDSEDLP